MNGKLWTRSELAFLRRHYRAEGMSYCAHMLDRSASSTYEAARNLGLAMPMKRVIAPDFDRFVKRHHKLGWSDAEIAAAWNAGPADRTINRRTLSKRRLDLGLASNANNERHRERVRRKTREQLDRAGLKSLADVRARAYRDFARSRGWPAELRPREVQILDVLYEQGPQTRKAIAEAIGWNLSRGQRSWLSCKYGRGSYLANLL